MSRGVSPKQRPKKNTGENSGGPVALVEQPHGGAIKSRGNPGNRGGPGRPRDEVKRLLQAAAREGVERSLPRIAEIASGKCVQRVRSASGEVEVLTSASPEASTRAMMALAELGDVLPDRRASASDVTLTVIVAYE